MLSSNYNAYCFKKGILYLISAGSFGGFLRRASILIIESALVFDVKDGFVRRDVYTDGERFSDSPKGGRFDASGYSVIPGLIDIHLHGCMGGEFSRAADAEQGALGRMLEYQASRGVTAVCPAIPAQSVSESEFVCKELAKVRCPNGAAVVGINLEGPFLSPSKLGAQNPKYVKTPDIDYFMRMQAVSKGLVKLVSVAPELEGGMEFIEELSKEAVCSIGHTAADYETAAEAFRRGARHVTHLYNAMPPFLHRAPGVVGAAFDKSDCFVELICDGVHVHPSAVRATFGMFGDGRIVMISDSMMAAGMGGGMYELGGLPVSVSRGVARLESGSLAGSACDLMDCLEIAVVDMGIPLHSAVKCASVNPAVAIGEYAVRGSIESGKYADLIILDMKNEKFKVKGVMLRGELSIFQ